MKFGLFLQPVHPPETDPTEALESDLQLVELLDSLGLDDVWIGEHHSTGWENIAAPDVFIAAAAARTANIRLGSGVFQLGLHNPLVLLDRMIFLDHLTRGRAMFGMGVGGGLPSDLTVFGLDKGSAGKRFAESTDAMLQLLEADAPLTIETDWFELHDAVLQMRPYSEPHMPFAVASASPESANLMGRVGGLVLTGPVPHLVPGILDHLEQGAGANGRTASREQIRLSYFLHVADSRDQAIDDIRDGMLREHHDFNVAVNGHPPSDLSNDELLSQFVDRHAVGSPEDVASHIEQVAGASGGVGGILFTSRDWAPTDAAKRSWELFAEQVMPKF